MPGQVVASPLLPVDRLFCSAVLGAVEIFCFVAADNYEDASWYHPGTRHDAEVSALYPPLFSVLIATFAFSFCCWFLFFAFVFLFFFFL